MKIDMIENKQGNLMQQAAMIFGGFVVLGFIVTALVYSQGKFTTAMGHDPGNNITTIEGNISDTFQSDTLDNVSLVTVLLVVGIITLVVAAAYGMTRLFGGQ